MQQEYKERKNRAFLAPERDFWVFCLFFFLTLRSPGCCLERHKWCSCEYNPNLPGSVTVPQGPGLGSAAGPAAKSIPAQRPRGLRGFPGLLNHPNTGTAASVS